MKDIKKCTKCQVEKELVEFSPHPSTKDGRQTHCRSCKREWASVNKDKIRNTHKKWNENNKENLKIYNKKYYEQNKERAKSNKQRYYKDNKEKLLEYNKKYYQENKEHYAEYIKTYQNERYHSDPDFKLSCLVRQFCCRVTNAVKEDKELQSLEYLGCSIAEFKAHIESQWQEGMTWENHSKDGWHIDHIKPLDWFIKNSDDPWQANHYLNLQPLWAEENHSKHNKF